MFEIFTLKLAYTMTLRKICLITCRAFILSNVQILYNNKTGPMFAVPAFGPHKDRKYVKQKPFYHFFYSGILKTELQKYSFVYFLFDYFNLICIAAPKTRVILAL